MGASRRRWAPICAHLRAPIVRAVPSAQHPSAICGGDSQRNAHRRQSICAICLGPSRPSVRLSIAQPKCTCASPWPSASPLQVMGRRLAAARRCRHQRSHGPPTARTVWVLVAPEKLQHCRRVAGPDRAEQRCLPTRWQWACGALALALGLPQRRGKVQSLPWQTLSGTDHTFATSSPTPR